MSDGQKLLSALSSKLKIKVESRLQSYENNLLQSKFQEQFKMKWGANLLKGGLLGPNKNVLKNQLFNQQPVNISSSRESQLFEKYKNVTAEEIIEDDEAPVDIVVDKLKEFKTPVLDLIEELKEKVRQ